MLRSCLNMLVLGNNMAKQYLLFFWRKNISGIEFDHVLLHAVSVLKHHMITMTTYPTVLKCFE